MSQVSEKTDFLLKALKKSNYSRFLAVCTLDMSLTKTNTDMETNYYCDSSAAG